ncbi:hypothetical protein [Deinococcus aerophilus]|nr:hypothetical protein [Deinococcus aerophilus]
MLLARAPSLSLELDTVWVHVERTPPVHLKDLRREGETAPSS